MLNYGPNENRKWTVNTDCDSVNVDVVKFDTEEFFDYLHIDDEKFSGADYTFQVNSNFLYIGKWPAKESESRTYADTLPLNFFFLERF